MWCWFNRLHYVLIAKESRSCNQLRNFQFFANRQCYWLSSMLRMRVIIVPKKNLSFALDFCPGIANRTYIHFLLVELVNTCWHPLGFEPPTYFMFFTSLLQFKCLNHGATPPVKSADSATFEVLLLCDDHIISIESL